MSFDERPSDSLCLSTLADGRIELSVPDTMLFRTLHGSKQDEKLAILVFFRVTRLKSPSNPPHRPGGHHFEAIASYR